jgi:uncharacterized membrane protein YeaQ/YmgE (transglycosylase-associated protein family)
MDNIHWIVIIGIAVGFIAVRFTKTRGLGLLINLIIGTGGAVLGGWLYNVLELSLGDGNAGLFITAFIGALLLLYLFNFFKSA